MMLRKLTNAYLDAILFVPKFPPEWPKILRFCTIGVIMTIKFVVGLSLYIIVLFCGMVLIVLGLLYISMLSGELFNFYDCFSLNFCAHEFQTPQFNALWTGGALLLIILFVVLSVYLILSIFKGVKYLINYYKKEFK